MQRRSRFVDCLRAAVVLVLLLSALPVAALAAPSNLPQMQVSAGGHIWSDADAYALARAGAPQIATTQARVVWANVPLLLDQLASAPLEGGDKGLLMALPMPDGTLQQFQVVESPIMQPELAARYPLISTYLGQGVDDRTATVRMDWTPQGFHAMILSAAGTVYIDPFRRGDTSLYISYYKDDFVPGPQQRIVELDAGGELSPTPPIGPRSMRVPSGNQLRTYRLAMAATGEYTQFHGGTVPLALAAIVTAMNRVNGIYEREVAIRMVLVANTDDLIYTDGTTDPYTNNNGSTMLGENQSNIDAVIGSANYDIGHVFSTGGGGVANQGPCQAASKARGVTGLAAPINDPFYVDYVSHEMGHQFGGSHTWNSNSCSGYPGQYVATAAYEPGSASTIMGYAGICGIDDLQPNSDDYFHTFSFDQIVAYSTVGAGTCGVVSNTGNTPPNVTSGTGGFTIPYSTPFVMSGTAVDPDGDALTFGWEEFDLPTAAGPAPPNPGYVVPPYFRSFDPTTSPSRTFPRLSDIVNNTTTLGEILPSSAANLTFRLTARDNRAGGGGVNYATYSIAVSGSAGPFRVATPNGGGVWAVADSETVTWDVANTTAAPVSCSAVNVKLSTDGGYTYPVTLLAGTANDGSEPVTVPDNETTQARVKVECADNIFFDISNSNFTIERQADLAMAKSDSPDPVAAGTELTYQLTVSNGGPSNSSGFLVTDALPAGVAFVSSPSGCSETAPGSGLVACLHGSLANGAAAAFTIVVAVDADLVHNAGSPVTIDNTASVSGNDTDPNPGNNSATEPTLVVAVADLAIVSFEALAAPAEILVGEDVTLTFRKVISNRGPSAPMDVRVTLTATPPSGATVTPANASLLAAAVGLNELREIEESFTVRCLEPSHHLFTFANAIAPDRPDDSDPDLSNNEAEITLDIECVVPVALNIKPASFPNSINLNNRGDIPLAVLTTLAGEYGLPLAFDATSIDPLSVRFGSRAAVWSETGGAFEVHNRGHIEDSYELDEVTRDGDLDMVLHFLTRQTGIMPGDAEACVKGAWTDSGGNVHKFFGCDSVRTVPGPPTTVD
jgi:uncharacterized repeat protein (TIGR01451 family)